MRATRGIRTDPTFGVVNIHISADPIGKPTLTESTVTTETIISVRPLVGVKARRGQPDACFSQWTGEGHRYEAKDTWKYVASSADGSITNTHTISQKAIPLPAEAANTTPGHLTNS